MRERRVRINFLRRDRREVGVGLRTRRYESCRGSFGASGARRCQHETGCNALREAMPARDGAFGQRWCVGACVEECGAAVAAAVCGGGMPLQSSGLALGGSLVTLEKDHGTALICTLSSILQQAYPHSRRAWAKPRRAWGLTMGTGISPRGTRRRPPLPCSRGSGTGPALTGVIDQGRRSKAGC